MAIETFEGTDQDMTDIREATEVPFSSLRKIMHVESAEVAAWDKDIEKQVKAFYGSNEIEGNLIVMVGKFEPPHPGHFYSIRTGLKLAEKRNNGKLVIIVGSPQDPQHPTAEEYKRYPFHYEDRVELLTRGMQQHFGMTESEIEKKVTFIEQPDLNNNKKWGETVVDVIEKKHTLGRIAAVMANDTGQELHHRSVWKIFSDRGMKLFVQNFHKREVNRGTEIRQNSGLFNRDGGPHRVAWHR